MGSGIWSTDVYSAAESYRAAKGDSAFAYSDSGARTVHDDLDPLGVAVRESRDSAEHPDTLAVAVLFDVTGSMGGVPRTLQTKLPDLLGLLLRKGYATDPQILFGAIGDATCDRAPLQVGQFESDNRMDEHLGKILLEGGGGGQKSESYELAMYFMARHTAIDCFEKRGRRGYLFIIGDELPYPKVKRREVGKVVGDRLRQDIPTRDLVAELSAGYDVYYILPPERATRGTIRCWPPGASCSARTFWSWTTWTRSARSSRSPSASARTPSACRRGWTISTSSARPPAPPWAGPSPGSTGARSWWPTTSTSAARAA